MRAVKIYVYAQFPRKVELSSGPGLDLNPTNWVWALCLTIPLKRLQDFSCRPYKWIRYAIGVVVGAQGHLSSAADSPNVVDYDASDIHTDTNPGAITRLYYHLTDADERRRMFPVSPEFERTFMSQTMTVRMMDFYDAVVERDGGTCAVTHDKKFCLPTHLLEHSKGDEYISTLTRARSRDPDRADVIEDIDSVRNGIFLNMFPSAVLGWDVAFLRTPNFAMDSADVDPELAASGDKERYTAQIFDTVEPNAHIDLGWNGPPHGSPIHFPNTQSPDWPPAILFDAVYAGAVLHTFGTKKIKRDIGKSWCREFYPSGARRAIGDPDETRFPHLEDPTPGPGADQFDMLIAAPFTFIPSEACDGYRQQAEEKIEREIRRGVGKTVKNWVDKVQLGMADGCNK